MSRKGHRLLVPALESAVAELERRSDRFEAYARVGEADEIRFVPGAGWSRRRSRRVGVACRATVAADGGLHGFGAAAGSAPRAGREAARAALAALGPGPDPLPPRRILGTATTPPPAAASPPEAVERLAETLATRLRQAGLGLHELRIVEGGSTSIILTGEGFSASSAVRGGVVEVVAAVGSLPAWHQHVAAPRLADVDAAALTDRVVATARAAGGTPGSTRRRLADVVLAPAVAAPLLLALASAFRPNGSLPSSLGAISAGWSLVDDRPGTAGIAPLPFDGEGLPARPIVLVRDGAAVDTFATWASCGGDPSRAGGTVRGSYREPPAAGAANLVLEGAEPVPTGDLLAGIDDGCVLLLPVSGPRFDPTRKLLTLTAAGYGLRRGRPVHSLPAVELRVSFRRLLANIAAVGDDPASFSLAAAVTTPSLLVRRVDVG